MNRIVRQLTEIREDAVRSKVWASRRLDEIAFERKKLDNDEQDSRDTIAQSEAAIASCDEIFARMADR